MGLVPELASSHFLVARCGWGAASWLALSGTTIQGEEAERLGLVDRVVDDDQVVEEAVADAATLAANPAPQLRMIKELLTANATDGDFARVQRRELEALEVAYTTPEHREAVQAFMEKRSPDFTAAARARPDRSPPALLGVVEAVAWPRPVQRVELPPTGRRDVGRGQVGAAEADVGHEEVVLRHRDLLEQLAVG